MSLAQNLVALAWQYLSSNSNLFRAMGCRIPARRGYRLAGRPLRIGVPELRIAPRHAWSNQEEGGREGGRVRGSKKKGEGGEGGGD